MNALWVVLVVRLALSWWTGGALSKVGAIALMFIAISGAISVARPANRAAAQPPPGQ